MLYGTPIIGSLMRSTDAINQGNYFDALGHFSLALAEGLLLRSSPTPARRSVSLRLSKRGILPQLKAFLYIS
jgi:hypothetical protein